MSPAMIGLLLDGLWETFFMVGVSAGIAALVGVPLGVILVVTGAGHIVPQVTFNRILAIIVNATRSTRLELAADKGRAMFNANVRHNGFPFHGRLGVWNNFFKSAKNDCIKALFSESTHSYRSALCREV